VTTHHWEGSTTLRNCASAALALSLWPYILEELLVGPMMGRRHLTGGSLLRLSAKLELSTGRNRPLRIQRRPLSVKTNPKTHSTMTMLPIMTQAGEFGGGIVSRFMRSRPERLNNSVAIQRTYPVPAIPVFATPETISID
jgi:hypothetical protein